MIFDPINHTYTEDGASYVPVTEFLKKFKPKFEKEIMAQRVSAREGRTAEEVLSEWELNAEISRLYGTTIHKAIEYWIRFNKIPKALHLKLAVEKFAAKYQREAIKPEIIVKNKGLKIAGTIDQLHLLGSNQVKITDVKTNGELTEESRGYFLAPLDKLPFSKMNEYRLQLSMYRYLLGLQGVETETISLEHWNGESYTTMLLEPINVEPLLLHA